MTRSGIALIVSGALLVVGMALVSVLESNRARRSSSQSPTLPVVRSLASVAVVDQSNTHLTLADLHGRPWVVNLIFTRCPGPCAQLTGVMREIQRGLPPGSAARLMSITSDPDHDTPEVLSRYAAKFGADTTRWKFVTGDRAEIRRLAVQEFLFVLQDKPESQRESSDDLFLHSTLMAVVDGRGQLRGVVEGLEPGAAGRILAMLQQVEAETGRP
ncbi:MAG: SCO family protein [Verrucomicrobiales bacterium]|nr:SCO family protein [Verrucomicrobiales bacterium]